MLIPCLLISSLASLGNFLCFPSSYWGRLIGLSFLDLVEELSSPLRYAWEKGRHREKLGIRNGRMDRLEILKAIQGSHIYLL